MEAIKTKAYGATGSIFSSLSEMDIERQPPKANELLIDILYCGVCHSDLHQVKNDWANTVYPCVPGHEIVGRVAEAGNSVTRYKVGDIVGVGCMIASCGHCHPCADLKEEQYCEGPNSFLATYNGPMKPAKQAENGGNMYGQDNTFGGYSERITVQESFVLRIPEALDIKAAAPILCAGVTTYSPLRHWGVSEGDSVGIVGLGGLGHMAVMLAKAMGAEVTVFTEHEEKTEAAKALGAHHVIVSTDKDAMKNAELTMDFILITIPDKFDVTPYVTALKHDGALVTVGLLGPYKSPLNNMEVAMHRRTVGGSLIGSIAETQEVLDFCAEHGIAPEVEMIRIQDINDAFKKMDDEEVRFRYVIDMQSLKSASAAS